MSDTPLQSTWNIRFARMARPFQFQHIQNTTHGVKESQGYLDASLTGVQADSLDSYSPHNQIFRFCDRFCADFTNDVNLLRYISLLLSGAVMQKKSIN